MAAARGLILRDVEMVFHCGDIGSDLVLIATAELFSTLDIPVYAVFGNCDHSGDYRFLPEEFGVRFFGRFGETALAGRRIAFLHGDDDLRLQNTVCSGRYDYVFCGHSHARRDEQIGPTRVINPGSAGRGMHPSCAVVDLAASEVAFFTVHHGD